MSSKILSSYATDSELLLRIKKLSWLCEDQISQLLRDFPARDVKRKEIIFDSHSATNRDIYLLLSGQASLVSYGRKNEGIVIATFPPGIIPFIPGFTAPVTHNYQCKAVVNCRVMKITRKDLIECGFRAKLPDNGFFEEIMDKFGEELGNLFTRYPSFLGLDLLTRVSIALLELAENFGIRDKRGVIIPHFFSHDDLADLVGGSRPRVTRAVSCLERQQIVGREGRHIVVDTLGLRDFIAARA